MLFVVSYLFLLSVYALLETRSVLTAAQSVSMQDPGTFDAGLADIFFVTFAGAIAIWSSKSMRLTQKLTKSSKRIRLALFKSFRTSLRQPASLKIVACSFLLLLFSANLLFLLSSNLLPSYTMWISQRLAGVLGSVALLVVIFVAGAFLVVRKPENATEILGVLITLSLFYWLYFHSVSQGTYQFLDYHQGSYYDSLASQLQSGQIGWINNGMPWADWAFYDGVNYLYFGPFPAILQLFIADLSQVTVTFDELTLIFSVANLIAFYVLLQTVAKAFKFDSKKTRWMRILFLVVYALGPLYFMAGRYFVYETAVIFGSTFLVFAAVSFIHYYNSHMSTTRRSVFLALSSLLLCLAFLSRVDLALCAIPLLVMTISKELGLWRLGKQSFRSGILLMLVVAIPIVSTASTFGFYNATRFGNPLEFGMSYQVVGDTGQLIRLREDGSFSGAYFWRNLYAYFFLMPQLSAQPPYFNYSALPDWLVGSFPRLVAVEWTSSAVFSSPILLFSVPALAWGRSRFRGNTIFLTLLFISALAPGLLFVGNARRYVQDFYPFLAVIAFVGFNAVWTRLPKRRIVKWLSHTMLVVIVLWTLLVAYNLNVQWGFLGDFGRAIRIFNDPSTFVSRSAVWFAPIPYVHRRLRKVAH